MRNLVIVSLILMLVVVIGVTIRGTIFRKYLPEGFENAEKEKTGTHEKKEEEEKEEEKEESDKNDAVQVDTASGMKNFMSELGGNKGAMNNISKDTQAMIQNQKELMNMMKSVQPALTQGMEFMKAFKGMMGSN